MKKYTCNPRKITASEMDALAFYARKTNGKTNE